jgi:hypothetical protein
VSTNFNVKDFIHHQVNFCRVNFCRVNVCDPKVCSLNSHLLTARVRTLGLFIVVLGACWPLLAANSERLRGIPELHAGQKFVYRVRYKTQKSTRSESRIAAPLAPEEVDSDTERYVAVEIKKVETKRVQGGADSMQVMMRTQLLPADGSPRSADDGVVEFTLLADGRADALRGFAALSDDEQALWRQWIAQFALGWTFPAKGVKVGEKWKKEEPVAGAALAKLVWEKQLAYVREEACPQSAENNADNASAVLKNAAPCAVVITTSTMKQGSSHDDATPDDYKLHQLKTSGSAQGKTDVLSFISLKTGMLQRANEDSAQTLDVLVAKADESNKAHFNVEATSHVEVILIQ